MYSSASRSLIGATPALADADADCGHDPIYDAHLDLVSTLASDVLVYRRHGRLAQTRGHLTAVGSRTACMPGAESDRRRVIGALQPGLLH